MLTIDRVTGLGLATLGALTLWASRELPLGTVTNPGPAAVPAALALLVLGLGALIGMLGAGAPPLGRVDSREWRHAVAILGVCVFAAVALERVLGGPLRAGGNLGAGPRPAPGRRAGGRRGSGLQDGHGSAGDAGHLQAG